MKIRTCLFWPDEPNAATGFLIPFDALGLFRRHTLVRNLSLEYRNRRVGLLRYSQAAARYNRELEIIPLRVGLPGGA